MPLLIWVQRELKKNLRRHSDKIKNHKISSFKDFEFEQINQDLTNNEVEIVPMDLELHKPLEFDDALENLLSDEKRQFIVFNDLEGLLRVMYKRKDDKIGLY